MLPEATAVSARTGYRNRLPASQQVLLLLHNTYTTSTFYLPPAIIVTIRYNVMGRDNIITM